VARQRLTRLIIAPGKDLVEALGCHSLLAAQDIGRHVPGLADLKRKPDEQGRKPGAISPAFPGEQILKQRLEHDRVEDMELLAHSLLDEGRGQFRVAETFRVAIRISSALSCLGSHAVTGSVCLLLDRFCVRDVTGRDGCDRAGRLRDAGWTEAMRARLGALLTCLTS
jgi:hypothetical protein